MSAIDIHPAQEEDWPALLAIFHEVLREGTTYVFREDTPEKELKHYWLPQQGATYVARRGASIVGVYVIKPNQPGRGSHVCNASFMVADTARGQKVGEKLGCHALKVAKQLGFQSMQFNIVVSTNMAALQLWEKLGFEVLCTLPRAFDHPQKGYVDAYLMHREL